MKNTSMAFATNTSGPREFGNLTLSLDTAYTTAEILIATAATLGNILVCAAIIYNRKLWTVTNYFLVSLATADVCVGAFAIPCAILTGLGIPYHNLNLCLFMLSILIMLTMCSTFSLLAVAVDRYVAILNPLRYKSIMTTRYTLTVIIMIWVFALTIGLVPIMGWHNPPSSTGYCLFVSVVDMTYMVYFIFFGLFILPLIVMFIIYAQIFSAVRMQIRLIATGMRQRDDEFKQDIGIKKEIKTATSLFTVIFLFVLCWAPLHIMNCVILFCPYCYIPPILLQTAIILTHANSAVNPVLYAYKMKSFRNTFKVIFSCRQNTVMPAQRTNHISNINLQ
ncbi:adenosine receptor A2b-like [Discoglossus pictus]